MPPAEGGLVVALAGRRVDAEGADPARFPLASLPAVRQRIRDLLRREEAHTLVCSAACGADLLALEVAAELGLRTRVVLPFEVERFRTSSVTDRPGDWGPEYDSAISRARVAGDLVVLTGGGDGSEAYAAANGAILDEAERLATALSARLLAVIVWDGQSRGPGDLTKAFATLARTREMAVAEIRI